LKALECLEGATPLDRDEAEGLRLTHITNREELNLNPGRSMRWQPGFIIDWCGFTPLPTATDGMRA